MMKIEISFFDNASERQIINLKDYIHRQKIDGLFNLEISQSKPKKGEMSSGGIDKALVSFIDSINAPLVQLVSCLTEYVKLFKTEIKLKNEKGTELNISSTKLSKDQITEIVKTFMNQE